MIQAISPATAAILDQGHDDVDGRELAAVARVRGRRRGGGRRGGGFMRGGASVISLPGRYAAAPGAAAILRGPQFIARSLAELFELTRNLASMTTYTGYWHLNSAGSGRLRIGTTWASSAKSTGST